MRKLAMGGIGHNAKGGKGQPISRSDFGRYVRFGVGRERARLEMKRVALGNSPNGQIDACYVGEACLPGGQESIRPQRIGHVARAILGYDRACDDLRARGDPFCQTARDAKTDDRRCLACRGFNPLPKACGVPATRERKNARPGRYSCFGPKTRNG